MNIYKHRLKNFQITFSLSALVGESFLNKPFCLFLVNLKATDIPFHNFSEKISRCLVNLMNQNFVKFLWRLYSQDFKFATVV